jgi:hypothetical protein
MLIQSSICFVVNSRNIKKYSFLKNSSNLIDSGVGCSRRRAWTDNLQNVVGFEQVSGGAAHRFRFFVHAEADGAMYGFDDRQNQLGAAPEAVPQGHGQSGEFDRRVGAESRILSRGFRARAATKNRSARLRRQTAKNPVGLRSPARKRAITRRASGLRKAMYGSPGPSVQSKKSAQSDVPSARASIREPVEEMKPPSKTSRQSKGSQDMRASMQEQEEATVRYSQVEEEIGRISYSEEAEQRKSIPSREDGGAENLGTSGIRQPREK